MKVVRKGIKVVCSHGHINGKLMRDVAVDGSVGPRDFGLDDAARTITPAIDGHFCSTCGERITQYEAGAFRVHTIEGWIGQLHR